MTQCFSRRDLLRRTARWGVALSTTAAGTAGTGCAAGGAGTTEPATLPATAVDIRFPMDAPAGSPAEQYFNTLRERLKDRYNDKIRIVADPWLGSWTERYEKWTAQALAGDAPDVIVLCCELMRPYFTAGNAQLLDPFIRRDWKKGEVEDFSKGMWEGMQLDRKQYGIPVYANTPTLFTNRNHLKEAGLPAPPEDWGPGTFLEYVSKLHRPADGRWGFQMSNYAQPNRHVLFVWAWGGEVHDPKDTGNPVTRLTYDHPRTVEALQFIHDLIWKHRYAPPTNAERGGLGAEASYRAGQAGVYLDGSHVLPTLLRQQEQDSSFDWDVALPVRGPGGARGARIGNDGYMIWKGSRNIEPTWTVIREIYTPEIQQARAEITLSQPAVKSAVPHWARRYPGKNMKAITTLLETARPDPNAYWKHSSEVNAVVVKHLQASFERHEVSVAEATRLMMTEIRGFLAVT
ncbi:MAG TPA: extracellular solute-binding protein [Chloroflexota bacterium]|nr:extracellular solute-binding protein [Chloroflexota bacterium]